MKSKTKWETRPINSTCEYILNGGHVGADGMICYCGEATSYAYPAMGCGWTALCEFHGRKHPNIQHINELITNGETFE